ncbi:protein kinase [Myxococcota bacterium]|nr:protein kinase [Myxococcota bacterium]
MAQQKYSIVEKLDAGGMAEVWKGKATSLRGFEKLVAIKRVLPNLAKNKKFIAMFLDEARLSLFLNHANVVQTFDIGMSENSYFIVMEFVDGSNLKSVLETAKERGFRIPQEQASYIAIEICKGLSHAHNRKDPRQRPLAIVHRDISPPNVLISREGEVKLVDFGLAKAASQLSLTDPGVVKGKFSYLSPEAAYGEKVNFLTDVFATGIVLWEMLANRRLFDGRTDLETVEFVRKAEIPPLKDYNPDVHPQLEAIIRRALSRDPRRRHQSALELAHDLSKFLFENRLMVTAYDISVLVNRVLLDRNRRPTDEPARPMNSHAQQIERMIQDEITQFTSLEDLERMSFKAVADHEPLDQNPAFQVGSEDPRDWAYELGVEDDGDHTHVELTPFEKESLRFQEGKSLEQLLEGNPGESSERAPQALEVPPPPPPRPPADRKSLSQGPPPLPPAASERTARPSAESRAATPAKGPATPGVDLSRTPNPEVPLTRTTGAMRIAQVPEAEREAVRAQAAAAAQRARAAAEVTPPQGGSMVKGLVAGVIVALVGGAIGFYFLVNR